LNDQRGDETPDPITPEVFLLQRLQQHGQNTALDSLAQTVSPKAGSSDRRHTTATMPKALGHSFKFALSPDDCRRRRTRWAERAGFELYGDFVTASYSSESVE
jgi:hypothetical protein